MAHSSVSTYQKFKTNRAKRFFARVTLITRTIFGGLGNVPPIQWGRQRNKHLMTLRQDWMDANYNTASVAAIRKRRLPIDWDKQSSHDGRPTLTQQLEHGVRRLQSADFVMTTVAPTAGFHFYQAAQQMKTNCHVDLSQIAVKLSMQLIGPDGLLHFPTDEQTPAEQVSLWNPVMDALGPSREQKCNNTQYIQFRTAMNNFQICVNLPNTNSSDFFRNVMGKHCGISSLLANTDNCTDALIADNRTLPIMQDIYQHTGKYCKCSSLLRQELPSCFVSVADVIDPSTTINNTSTSTISSSTTAAASTTTSLGQAHQRMKFSLGFFQSTLLCAVDLTCHAMTGWCVRQLHELERCLAEKPGCRTGTNVSLICQQNDIFTLPFALTQGKLPDVCLDALDTYNINRSVIHDFASYVEKCQAQEWMEKNLASSSSSSQRGRTNDMGWIIQFTLIVGLIVLTSAILVARRWLRRSRQNQAKQRFHPAEIAEQEELHGLQSIS